MGPRTRGSASSGRRAPGLSPGFAGRPLSSPPPAGTLTFAEASFGAWEDLASERVEHYEEKEKDELMERWEERGQYIAESDFGLAAALDPTDWNESPEGLMEFLERLSDDYA